MPELAGAVGFSRVSDGRSDPRQPALCLLDHSLLVLSSSGTRAHPAGVSVLPSPHLCGLLFTF